MLDFASGFGRTSRFLVRAMRPEAISVAEIDPAAVRFQETYFGVSGTVSGHDPESFQQTDSFDVILACSFFSHLPAVRFEGWLRRLSGLLAPGGMLIFTVHGMDLLPPLEADPVAGIVFRSTSETTRLHAAEYGTTYVTEEFVRRAARGATGNSSALIRRPFGLAGFQDVYVLLRPPVPPVLDLTLPRCPWGAMDNSAIEAGVVSVAGWASGDGDEPPPEITLHLGNQIAEVLPGGGALGAQRRWNFSFGVSAVDPDEIIRVEAKSIRGLSTLFVAETLRPYFPPRTP